MPKQRCDKETEVTAEVGLIDFPVLRYASPIHNFASRPLRPRVLVTRATRGASTLAAALEDLGLEPILLPAIATVAPDSFALLDHALAHLDDFHWLIFTSATAVEAFAARLGTLHIAAIPPATRIAAVGPATARALEVLGRTADLTPPKAVAESLTEVLLPFARQSGEVTTRFLFPRAEEARDLLPGTLQAAGGEVTVAPAYRTVIPPGSVAQTYALFSHPAAIPDAITFTSSSTARNLLALCASAGVTLPASARRVSIGPITSETLRELGIPPHAESSSANVTSLAEATYMALKPTNF